MTLRMRVHDKESIGVALRRFKKLIERSGMQKELRAHQHYEKPSELRRRATLHGLERRSLRERAEPRDAERTDAEHHDADQHLEQRDAALRSLCRVESHSHSCVCYGQVGLLPSFNLRETRGRPLTSIFTTRA